MLLSSVEVTAVSMSMTIVDICVSEPLRWLSANASKLSEHGWTARHMSKVFDILETCFELLLTDPTRLIDQQFMENIFTYPKNVLPPFAEFLDHKCKNKNKQMC